MSTDPYRSLPAARARVGCALGTGPNRAGGAVNWWIGYLPGLGRTWTILDAGREKGCPGCGSVCLGVWRGEGGRVVKQCRTGRRGLDTAPGRGYYSL